MRIEGASALVAGGASGLGAATARRLRAGGADVTIADLNAQAGEALAAELGARFVACDVTDAAQVEAAVAATPRACASPSAARASAGPRRPRASAGRMRSSRSRR